MAKLTDRRSIETLKMLSIIVYFFSYFSRINYAAIIVELVAQGIATRPQAALVTTVAFITYGIGQLISGYIGDSFSPRMLIFYGYIATAAMNFLMPIVSSSYYAMAVVWGINGLAQAFMWPPLSKIMACALNGEDYASAIPHIGIGGSAATICIYLFSPLVIKTLGWKFVFIIPSIVTVVAAFSWIIITKRLLKNVDYDLGGKRKTKEIVKKETSEFRMAKVITRLLPVIIFSIAVQGVLRDGITTWLPSYVSESFNLPATTSILTAVILPLFHIINNVVSAKVFKALKYKTFNIIAIYFSVISMLLILLYLFGSKNMWLALILISVSFGMTCGVNILQTGYIPKYFIATGKVSTISGVTNFSTYIGSATSTYLFAAVSESFGWNATIFSWVLFAVSGTVISVFLNLAINKKTAE